MPSSKFTSRDGFMELLMRCPHFLQAHDVYPGRFQPLNTTIFLGGANAVHVDREDLKHQRT